MYAAPQVIRHRCGHRLPEPRLARRSICSRLVTELRLAVVGVGDVAQRDYLPELHRLAGRARLVAISSRSPERVRAVAERYPVALATTDVAEILACEDVDAVLNLTPFDAHVGVTLAALRAGKHVYSEKPLAPDTAAAAQIREEAQRRGLVVVAAPSVLVFPQVRRAAEIAASGELGPIHSARGHGLGGVPPWDGYASDPAPFFARGGGPLRDMAVYPLHALTGILGPVRRVAALGRRTRSSFVPQDGPAAGREIPVEVPDNWRLLVEHEGGALSSVEADNCAAGAAAPELELRGEAGVVAVSLLDMTEPVRVLEPGGSWRVEQPQHPRPAGPDHVLGVEELVACAQSGRPTVLSVEHALHVIEVLEAAAVSDAEGATVAVRSSFPGRAASAVAVP